MEIYSLWNLSLNKGFVSWSSTIGVSWEAFPSISLSDDSGTLATPNQYTISIVSSEVTTESKKRHKELCRIFLSPVWKLFECFTLILSARCQITTHRGSCEMQSSLFVLYMQRMLGSVITLCVSQEWNDMVNHCVQCLRQQFPFHSY